MSVGTTTVEQDLTAGLKRKDEKQRKKSVGWLVAGNAAAAIAQWLYLVMATKAQGVEAAGIFAYSMAVCTPIVMLTALQMRALQASDVSGQFHFSVYFSLRLFSSIVAVLLIGIFAFVHRENSILFFSILACGLIRLSESVSETIYGRLQNLMRFTPMGVSLVLRNLLSPVAFLVTLQISDSLSLAILSAALTTVSVLLLFDFRWMPAEKWISDDRVSLKKLFLQALPLGGTSMLLSVQGNIPRYLLRLFAGDYAVGIYASLAQLPLAAAVLVRALGDSSSPVLARYYREKQSGELKRIILRLLAGVSILFLCGFLLTYLFGKNIVEMLYTTEHSNYLPLLFLLIAGEWIAQMSSVLGYVATAVRALSQQPVVILLSTTTIVLLGYLLTQSSGLIGVALAVMAGNTVMLLCYAQLIRTKLIKTIPAGI